MRFFPLVLLLLTGCQSEQEATVWSTNASDANERFYQIMEERAADGDLQARFHLVLLREHFSKQYDRSLPAFEILADDGHAGAAGMLASAYMHGNGVPVDYDEAARWLERAAELGGEGAAEQLAHYRAYRAEHPEPARDTVAF